MLEVVKFMTVLDVVSVAQDQTSNSMNTCRSYDQHYPGVPDWQVQVAVLWLLQENRVGPFPALTQLQFSVMIQTR